MSKKNRKIIRRLITVFIAIIIVAGIVLSQSSDRMLKATAVPEEDYPTMAQAGYTEEELPDEVDDIVSIPLLEKSYEPEEPVQEWPEEEQPKPEPFEEPVQDEPHEEQMVLGIQKAEPEPEQLALEAEPVLGSKEEQPVLGAEPEQESQEEQPVLGAEPEQESQEEQPAIEAEPVSEIQEEGPVQEQPAQEAEPEQESQEEQPEQELPQIDESQPGEEPGEEDTEAQPEEAASPAQFFSQSQNGLVIDVEAPEGAFPADTQMYLTDVSEESIRSLVSNEDHGQILSARAVSLSFYQDGAAVSPDQEIRITIYAQALEGQEGHTVFYAVNDSMSVQEIRAEGNTASFSTADLAASLQTVAAVSYQETAQEQEYTEEPSIEEPSSEEPSREIYYMEDETTEEVTTEEATEEEVTTEEVTTEEETSEEETTEEATTEEEILMPEMEFKGTASNGVQVSVYAPEGAFPEGTVMKVAPVSSAYVKSLAQDSVEGQIVEVWAVDISFYDQNGMEIHPEQQINVVLQVPEMDASSEQELIHISDGGDVSVISEADVNTGGAEFSSADFSTYAVLNTSDAEETVSVTFVVDDQMETISVQKGSTVEFPADPQKEGYDFLGWYTYDGEKVQTPLTAEEDLVLQARFADTWEVVFSADGTVISTVFVQHGQSLSVLPDAPELPGQTFMGWFSDGSEVTEDTAVYEDMSITARYGYHVSFRYDNNGEYVDVLEKVIEKGDTLHVLPADPFRSHYSFRGWFYEDGTAVSTDDAVTQDTVITGYFDEIRIYTITVEYYYTKNNLHNVIDTTVVTVDGSMVTQDAPVNIISPSQFREDSTGIYYYPAQQTIQIFPEDLQEASETGTIERSVEYSTSAVDYSCVYLLKDLDSDEYTEVPGTRSEGKAVMGSLVTPEIKYNITGAVFEKTQPYTITSEGQELAVYYTRENYTLAYDCGGGSGVDPVVAPYESVVTVSKETPERTGYRFKGWYLDKNCTQKAGTTVKLVSDTVLYAGWEGENVAYTIVYMKEKYDASTGIAGYVYDNSKSGSAKVGTTVKASSAPALTNNITGYEADTSRNNNSSVTIAADGSSVLYVYYRLKEYTFKFNAGTYSSKNVTATLTGKNTSGTGTLSYTMTVKLGQDISSEWPANVTGTYKSGWSTYSVDFNGWLHSASNTRYVTKRTIVTQDMLPSSGTSITYTAQWTTNAKTYTVNYWLQNADDDGYTNSSVYSQTYTSSSGNLGAKDIAGYTYHHGNSGASNVTKYDFYYNRNTYSIDYYYAGRKLETKNNIKFDANINTDTYNWTPAKPAGMEDYTWGGWCSDAGLTTSYPFSGMPASNLVLYAKWIAPRYTVTFHNNYDGAEDLYKTVTVDKNQTAGSPGEPGREYYRFLGWFTQPTGGTEYLPDLQLISDDLDVYAHWELIPLEYTVRYILKETGESLFTDKVVRNPSFAPGELITEEAVTVAGYIPYDSTLSLNLSYDPQDNILTFQYVPKQNELTYTVRYVLRADPTIEVAPSKTASVSGTYASITEMAAQTVVPEYADYHPEENTKTLQLGANSETNILTFYYVPDGAYVSIRYADMNGETIPGTGTVTGTYAVGSTFTVPVNVNGYVMDHIEDNISPGGAGALQYDVQSNASIGITVYMKKSLTITAASKTRSYDGTQLSLSGVKDITYSGLLSAHTITQISLAGSITDAGTTDVIPSAAVISPVSEDYYDITYVPGTLTITQASVVINVEPDRWNDGEAYNGQTRTIGFRYLRDDPEGTKGVEINNSVYERLYGLSIRDMVRGISLSAADAGFYKIPSSDILAAITLPEDDNFHVILHVRDGELTIPKAQMTVSTGSAEKVYDGTALVYDKSDVSGLVGNESVTVTVTGTQTAAGSSVNTYEIVWDNAKESNYEITEQLGTLTVNKADLTITAVDYTGIYDGAEHKGAVSGEVPEDQVQYSIDGGQTWTDAAPSIKDVGTLTYLVRAGENSNYNTAQPASGTLTVTARQVSVTVNNASKTYGDEDPSFTAVTAGLVEGDEITVTLVREEGENVGSYQIVPQGEEVQGNYLVSFVPGELSIAARPITVTTGSASKAYDGQPLTADSAEITGLREGDNVTVKATGTLTDVGSTSNTYEISWNEVLSSNYQITENTGTLTVTENTAEVVLTAASANKTYNGEALTDSSVTASGLPEGFRLQASASGSQTDAGSSDNTVNDGYVILNGAGEDVTSRFTNIVTVKGTLTVNPCPLTITTGSASKEYDGTPLASEEISSEGLVAGESVTLQATGSITNVGTADNTYELEWSGAKEQNYQIVEKLGTLCVTENTGRVTLTASGASKTYDGQPLSSEDVSVSGLPEGFTVTAITEGTITDAGTAVNKVVSYQILDQDRQDRTSYFSNIELADGYLTIKKADVVFTSASDEKVYDGLPLVKEEVAVTGDGFASGQGATFTVTGQQTDTGSSDNTFEYALTEGTDLNNYNISIVYGTLKVTPVQEPVTVYITGNSDSKVYDGKLASVTGYTVGSISNELYTENDFVSSSDATAFGKDAAVYDMGLSAADFSNTNANFANVEFVVTDGKLEISKRSVTLTSADDSKVYDGQALTNEAVTVTGDGFAEGEGAVYDVTGSQTDAGSSNNAFTYTLNETTLPENYDITTKEGILTVTAFTDKVTVTVTGNSGREKYDGTEKSVSGYTAAIDKTLYTESDFTFTGTANVSGTNAGIYEMQLGADDFANINPNFTNVEFVIVDGKLLIAKRDVTLTSGTASREYNGQALTNKTVTATGDGFAEGEGASYDVTGSQLTVGSSKNTFTYTLNEGTNEDNYKITAVNGTLTVTDRAEKYPLTVTGSSDEFLYDGTEKTVSGLEAATFTVNDSTYTVRGLSASASGTDAGTYPVEITGTVQVIDEFGNDVTDQFAIDPKPGTLTIKKREVTMTSATASREYNGQALTNDDVAISGDGFAEGEGASYDVTGSQLTVGFSENIFTYTLNEGTNADNYAITTAFGTLTVTNRNAKYEITVTAKSGEFKYDGTEKSVSGLVETTFEVEGNTYTVSGLNASASGTNAGSYLANVTGTPVVKDAKGNDVSGQFAVETISGTLQITKRVVTLTSVDDSKIYDGQALTNNEVTVGEDGFAEGEGASYEFTGSQTETGSSDNGFTYALNEGTSENNYEITKTEGTLTVTAFTDKVTVTVTENSGSEKYDGTEKSISGYKVSIDKALYTESDFMFTGSAEASGTDAGTYEMKLRADDFTNNNLNFTNVEFVIVDGKLQIAKREVTLTSADDSKEYDGRALTNGEVTISGEGFVEGEGASYAVTGSQLTVGSSENTFTYTLNEGTNKDNYDITAVKGTLTVTDRTEKYPFTVTGSSGEFLYDGTEKTVSGLKEDTFTVNGITYTVIGLSASANGTDAGTYPVEITGTVIVTDEYGNDVTDQFAIDPKPGTLTINKRQVTMTSATASREYNGQALANDKITVSGDRFAAGEGASYDVTGSQLTEGSSENKFTYTLNEGTKADNYDITTAFGTLTVTNRDAKYKITVTAKSGEYKYDGTEKSVSGLITDTFEVEGNKYTVSGLDASASGTNAGSYPVNVTGTPVVTDAQNNDVSGQFAVGIENGTLDITKRVVTLTSADDNKVYDGKALTNEAVTVGKDGFAEGEGASYRFTGSQTEAGESANAFSYMLDEGTSESNYEITKTEGTLTVTAVTDKVTVTITENSGNEKYDGTQKFVSGYDAVIDNLLYTENDFTFTGSAIVSGTDAGTYAMQLSVADFANNSPNFTNVEFVIVDGELQIAKRKVTLTSADDSKEYDGQALTNGVVTVSGDGFAVGEGVTYQFTGSQTEVGESANTFSYTLDEGTSEGNYEITTAEGILTVTPLSKKVIVTVTENSGSEKYDGTEKTVSGYTAVIDNPLYKEQDFTFSGDDQISGTDADTYEMQLSADDFANINPNFSNVEFSIVDGSLQIAKRNVILTSATASRQYNGQALTNDGVTATGDGFAEGEGASYNVTGSQLTVGSSVNTFTYTLNEGTKADNYDITTAFGTLTITNRDAQYEITVTAKSDEVKYDGAEKSVSGLVETTFEVEGNTYTVSGLDASASGINAGSYPVNVIGTPVVKDAQGNDVSDQFAVETVDGALKITKREVTLTSASAEKEYDGNPLTNDTVTITGDDFVEGEGASFDVTGSRTIVGESPNTFTYTLNEGTKADNYKITTVVGTLTVKDRTEKYPVTITGNSGEFPYDGTEKTISGLETDTIIIDGNTYTISGVTTETSGVDAGTYPGSFTGTIVITDQDGNDVTDQFAITPAPGTLKITKRKVTLTSASAEKEYDGKPLTAEEVAVSDNGFVDGEGASFEVIGSQTIVGESSNTFTYTLNEGTKADNYDITTEFGTLSVKDRAEKYPVTITGTSGEFPYDGTEKTISGLETTIIEIDGNTYEISGVTTETSGVDAGTYPGSFTGTIVIKDAEGNDVTDQFAIEPAPGTLTITKREVTLTSASAEKEYDGNPLTDGTVTITGDGFVEGEGAVFEVTGSQTIVGESSNTFTYTLNEGTKADNYDITTEFGTLSVKDRAEKYPVTITGNSGEFLYDGTEKTISGLETTIIEIDGNIYEIIAETTETSGVDAGTYPGSFTGTIVIRDADGNDVTDQFAIDPKPGTLKITKRKVTLTSASAEKEYDGNPLTNDTVTITGDGFVDGEGASFDVTGSQTLVGETPNTFTYTLNEGTKAENYDITTIESTLQITSRDVRYEINIQALSSKALYDGTEHSTAGFEAIEFTIEGNTYTVEGLTAGASGTDAGIYPAAIEGTAVVRDSAGNDVTSQFIVNQTDGSLEIAAREVAFTSASAEKEYDGDPLTADTVTISGDGFAEGEGASFTVTGQQLTAGFSGNAFTYTLKEGTKADNYIITTEQGTLTVTNRNTRYEIEVTAKSGTYQYDGESHSAEGLESTRFGIGKNYYTVEGLSASASGTRAGTYTVPVTGTAVVRDKSGNDVTDQFTVKAIPGTLTIVPRTIRFISDGAEQVYNGHPLTNGTVTITGDGFVEGEGADFTVTGSRTLAGASENTFRYTLKEGTTAGDYIITTAYGTLTVLGKPEDARFEITASGLSDTVLYDGQNHVVSGIRLLGDISDQQIDEQGNITFTIDGVSYTLTGLTSSVSAVNAGTYKTNVEGTARVYDAEGNDVSDQFLIHTPSGELAIGRRQVTMTSGSASATYTGRLLTQETVEVTGDGFIEGEGASYLFSGGRSIVGVSENTFDYELAQGTDAGNYDITRVFGTLTITNRDARYLITVTARSAEFLYDGTEHTVSGLRSNNITIDGVTYIIQGLTASASAVDAGEYQVNVTGIAQIVDPAGNDVTDQFAIETRSGTLRIRPRTVVFTSANASKEFDGTALRSDEITVSGDGFAAGEGAYFISTAQRILVGTTQNTFTWILQDNTKEGNYIFQTAYGVLNVLNRDAVYSIVLTANSDSVPYDGQEHEVSGFEQTDFEIGGNTYHVEGISAYASGTQAGIYSTSIFGAARVLDAAGNDVTGQFAVEVVNGSLTIRDTYLLTIRFVDENGADVRPPVILRFEQGEDFGPVDLPEIDGLVPDFDAIVSPADGMPARDMEVVVVYRNPAPISTDEEEPGARQEEPTGSEHMEPEVIADEPETYRLGIIEINDNGDTDLIEIDDYEVPLAAPSAGYWALVNLLLALCTVFGMILIAVIRILARKEKEDENDEKSKAAASEEEEEDKYSRIRKWMVYLSPIPAVAAVIIFLLTEDMTKSMTMVDKWTILMAVIFLIELVLLIFSRKKKQDEEEEEY